MSGALTTRPQLRTTRKIGAPLPALAACISLCASLAHAQSVEQFYRGKTLTMIISVGPGDGFDLNGRLVARHLARHIPGNPTIVAKNMSGAGHMLAVNYMFNE